MFNQMGRDNLLAELRAAEAEIERLRAVLERMDDRKNPMMPRSQMARIAIEALNAEVSAGE